MPSSNTRTRRRETSTPLLSGSTLQPADAFRFEALEDRCLFSAVTDISSIVVSPSLTLTPQASAASSIQGYTPAQIRKAYGFDSITGDGSGQTIAIVDAYDDPTIAADLKVFSRQFGLSSASFSKLSQSGSITKLPAVDAGWSQETALDVEWAHAAAPGAKIVLVEAKSDRLSDLLTAVDFARSISSVSVVSMSWGSSEFFGQTGLDTHFTTPAGHQGITFVASSGDDGSWYGPSWPASSANVLAVGGTSLALDSSGNVIDETGWSDSGGGISSYVSEPSYQSAAQHTGGRTSPDVSINADPYTGYAVYSSTAYQGYVGWMEVGGTSAGSPQWAGIIALANQARVADGLGALNGAKQTLPMLYALYSSSTKYSAAFTDVDFGASSWYLRAHAGYDGVTGLGSPHVAGVVSALDPASTSAAAAAKAAKTATATASVRKFTSTHHARAQEEQNPQPQEAALALAAPKFIPIATFAAAGDALFAQTLAVAPGALADGRSIEGLAGGSASATEAQRVLVRLAHGDSAQGQFGAAGSFGSGSTVARLFASGPAIGTFTHAAAVASAAISSAAVEQALASMQQGWMAALSLGSTAPLQFTEDISGGFWQTLAAVVGVGMVVPAYIRLRQRRFQKEAVAASMEDLVL